MARAAVNPKLVGWARHRAGLTPEMFAKKIQTSEDNVKLWESGELKPTFNQARRIAKVTKVPFGYLFLQSPPEETPIVPDFRKPDIDQSEDYLTEISDLLRDVQYKLDWYREYRLQNGALPLNFVGSFSLGTDAREVADSIRAHVGGALLNPNRNSRFETHLTELTRSVEQVGIWVMRSGVIANNTHRPLPVQAVRGFSVADIYTPLVFINARDAKAAQIFTLVHELAHIWFGQSGISDPLHPDKNKNEYVNLERKCNSVASHALLPDDGFLESWNEYADNSENIEMISQKFKVSSVVAAIKAYTLGYISSREVEETKTISEEMWRKQSSSQSTGGDFYRNTYSRNGASFTEAVVERAVSGSILLREAGRLLNMNPHTVQKIYDRKRSAR
jgi:Zn-dependent peptidase ImmA (M78 family)/DNA-binding XRE family transcriptional regulator